MVEINRKKPGYSLFLWVLLAWVIPFFGGCAPQGASFEFGLGTTEIRGRLNFDGDAVSDWQPVIVVFKYHYKFIPLPSVQGPFTVEGKAENTDQGTTLLHPTAHVVPVASNGEYAISLPADVVSVYVIYAARQRLSDVFRYARSLGVGRVTYHARLPVMGPDWRSHFFTFIEPQLQNTIAEPRFLMPPQDQKILGDWLTEQKNILIDAAATKKADQSE